VISSIYRQIFWLRKIFLAITIILSGQGKSSEQTARPPPEAADRDWRNWDHGCQQIQLKGSPFVEVAYAFDTLYCQSQAALKSIV